MQRLRRDDGFSLIELLVVMILLSVISGIVVATMIGTMRSTRQAQNRASSADAIQSQLERIARDLRVADPIRAASATSITVDNYRGTGCFRETWSLSSGSLVRALTTFAASSACTVYPATATPLSSSTQTMLTGLSNSTLFTYEDSSGNTITNPTPSAIAVVHATITQAGSENRGGVTFDTSVGVRNETLQ